MVFFVIALVFWYGSRLVSNLEISTFRFFVGLMVGLFQSISRPSLTALYFSPPHSVLSKPAMSSLLFQTFLRPRVQPLTSSSSWILSQKLMQRAQLENRSTLSKSVVSSSLTMSTSDTLPDPACVFSVAWIWPLSPVPLLRWLVNLDVARVLCMFLCCRSYEDTHEYVQNPNDWAVLWSSSWRNLRKCYFSLSSFFQPTNYSIVGWGEHQRVERLGIPQGCCVGLSGTNIIRWDSSLQHPSRCNQTKGGSRPRRDRGRLPESKHFGLHTISTRVRLPFSALVVA